MSCTILGSLGEGTEISTAFTKKHPAKAPVVSTGNTEVSEMSLRTSSFNFGVSSDMASLPKWLRNEGTVATKNYNQSIRRKIKRLTT